MPRVKCILNDAASVRRQCYSPATIDTTSHILYSSRPYWGGHCSVTTPPIEWSLYSVAYPTCNRTTPCPGRVQQHD